MRSIKANGRLSELTLIASLLAAAPAAAQVNGVAAGIPEPDKRNSIVQLFNWRFNDIRDAMPTLRALGYSHIHVSPAQKSNEHVSQWWGRYQPIDFTLIEGPLGSEAEYKQMNDAAASNSIQIIADVVLNHTVDITEQPPTPFIVLSPTQDVVVSETFPQFSPADFHKRCNANSPPVEQTCWLSDHLADLVTTNPHVRQVAKAYLQKLAALGVDGYRFDAAIHIEPEYYTEVLSVVPGKFAVGEIIKDQPSHFQAWLDAAPGMDFKDFPRLKVMREAFRFEGDLRTLKDPESVDRALSGVRSVTIVRNHDIDRGQAPDDRGLRDGQDKFGIGWDGGSKTLDRTDVRLAYAYIFGIERGFPYVFVDMTTLEQQDDRVDDPFIVAGVRFHNLCLASEGGVPRREEIWRIETPTAIGWQRGTDRFVVINKADAPFEIVNLATTLQPSEYKEVRTGFRLDVQPDGTIKHWKVPERTAVMFVRVGT